MPENLYWPRRLFVRHPRWRLQCVAGHCYFTSFSLSLFFLYQKYGHMNVVFGYKNAKNWGKQILTHGAKDGEREKRDWTMVITMASYALQTPPRVAHAKPPGPKYKIHIFPRNGGHSIYSKCFQWTLLEPATKQSLLNYQFLTMLNWAISGTFCVCRHGDVNMNAWKSTFIQPTQL